MELAKSWNFVIREAYGGHDAWGKAAVSVLAADVLAACRAIAAGQPVRHGCGGGCPTLVKLEVGG